ncbi:MAG: gamma-glutamyl-gamma-aminobutyrate hydrolase family protein [Candidatus Margulisbacteria bacterium]|nr:gamma-glutamyl-gamma-aminobutyrate hydrolase family protein [Candidatus Margulisiibacteriota bacterium]
MKKHSLNTKIKKPYIGITCEVQKLKYGFAEFELTCDYRYIQAIFDAGGLPVLIPITNQEKDLSLLLDNISGIVIVGGADIHPKFYNEKIRKEIKPAYRGRVKFEIQLYHLAEKKKIPILAICYGMQLLNVIHGGTLFQDIQSEIKGTLNHQSKRNLFHKVEVQKDTLCYKIFKECSFPVYSRHHQAIKTLGKDLKISAFAQDGIVEAIEKPPYIVGVQWHPEQQLTDPRQQRLFRYFVNQARAKKS